MGTLDHGKFELRPFTIDFPSGRADGVLGLDLNGARPAFRLDGTVRNAALSSLLPGIAKTVSGTVELQVHVAGAGASFRDVALNAEGRIGVRLRDGAIQKSKADVISGAVVQGAFTALANKNARTALPCAVADLGVRGGKVSTRRVLLVTDVGTAVADGAVNLAGETLDLTIYGRPSRFRLFAVNAPVTIGGPMLHPQVQVRLGGGDKRDPAHPAPQAPKVGEGDRAAFCSQQLAGGL